MTKKQIKDYLDNILVKSCCISEIRRLDGQKIIITDISSEGQEGDFDGPFSVKAHKKYYGMAYRVKEELEKLGFTCVPPHKKVAKEAYCYIFSIDTKTLEGKLQAILRRKKLQQIGIL